VDACTIIARNYIAYARALARSFFEHHPGSRFTVLIIDGDDSLRNVGGDEFEVMLPDQIGIDEDEFGRMAMLYDVMELATAVKPSLLKTLLARGGEDITYFDPDIEVFTPLDDISDLAREHSIVLTPHILAPLPHHGGDEGEVTLLLAGMFNLGFIGVGRGAAEFLDWWAERLARSGHVLPKRGQFVDQRWVDFVPALFEHVVLRDPACNVAHWNLETRRFDRMDDEYRVEGTPLRFFHYSGFDPERPFLLSKFLGRNPRILLSEQPALAHICAQYAEKVLAAGYREAKAQPYGFGTLPNGVRITPLMRRVYSRALRAAEQEDGDEPPPPFDDADRFVAWLNEPMHPAAPEFTRYLADLYARRPRLQREFPDPRWIDGERFRDWIATTGRETEGIPPELIPPPRPPKPEPSQPLTGGVNVSGYFRAEAGVGQAARHVLNGLGRSKIPHTTMVYGETLSRQDHTFEESGGTPYDVNVICVNADELPRFAYDVGPEFFRDRYSVGIWWWEVSRFPERYHDAFQTVDEIWVGSDFVREAIAAETDKPVLTLPLGIELPEDAPPARDRLGLPEGFMFLFTFDFDSVFERKNPLGVVEAFRRAFPPESDPTLVLKSINGDRWLTKLEQLRAAASGRDDIRIFDRYLSAAENEAMMAACNCYVSLHRSEGFGLTIAEAMAHGKPVIATGYSGNLAFMDEETSFVVPHRLVPIPAGVEPYPAGGEWADPDLEAAAATMRHVYEHQKEAQERGRRARERVATQLAPERTAAFLENRLGEIRRLRAGSPHRQPTASSALERAAHYLSKGPRNPIRGPSRLGPIGRLVRRVLRHPSPRV
jgi:glycosyltransferase involved in cell wall biosynthesis